MQLFLKHKERDQQGVWRFWVTPNPQLPGHCAIRHIEGTWACNCVGWSEKLWSPVAGTTMPCEHIHFAYMHYIEVLAKANQMKAKVAEAVQRVRSQNEFAAEPVSGFVLEPKRKIKLEE